MSESNSWLLGRRRVARRTILRAGAKAGVGVTGLALVGCEGDDDDEQADAQVAAPAEEQEQVEQAAQQAPEQAAEQAAEEEAQEEEAAAEIAEEEEEEQAQAAGPVRGGVLRWGTNLAVHDFWDPHKVSSGRIKQWATYGRLIRWSNIEEDVLEPDIASLPEIPDDETYIFAFDRGARFWDRFPTEGGREFTAEDARINMQRHIDGRNTAGEPDSNLWMARNYRRTSSIEATDPGTLVLKTDGPDSTYLESVHLEVASNMTSPEAIEAFGAEWESEPFKLLASSTGLRCRSRSIKTPSSLRSGTRAIMAKARMVRRFPTSTATASRIWPIQPRSRRPTATARSTGST